VLVWKGYNLYFMKKFLSGFFVAVLFIPAFVVAAPDTLLSLQKEITYLKSQIALYSSSLKLMADRIDYLTEENAAYREQIASFGAVPVVVEPVVVEPTPAPTPVTSMPSQPVVQPTPAVSEPVVGASSTVVQPVVPVVKAPVKPTTTTMSEADSQQFLRSLTQQPRKLIISYDTDHSIRFGANVCGATNSLDGMILVYNGQPILSQYGNEIPSVLDDDVNTRAVRSDCGVRMLLAPGANRQYQIVVLGNARTADIVYNLTF
jgi:hypothetical protein